MKLYKETLQLIEDSKLSTRHIAELCGYQAQWIHLLRVGKLNNPSVHRVQVIHDKLHKQTKEEK